MILEEMVFFVFATNFSIPYFFSIPYLKIWLSLICILHCTTETFILIEALAFEIWFVYLCKWFTSCTPIHICFYKYQDVIMIIYFNWSFSSHFGLLFFDNNNLFQLNSWFTWFSTVYSLTLILEKLIRQLAINILEH